MTGRSAIDLDDLEQEDATYQAAIQQVLHELAEFDLPVQLVHRQHLSTVDFGMFTVVVAVGQDGLVANTAKYVGRTPIIGVNPDPPSTSPTCGLSRWPA